MRVPVFLCCVNQNDAPLIGLITEFSTDRAGGRRSPLGCKNQQMTVMTSSGFTVVSPPSPASPPIQPLYITIPQMYPRHAGRPPGVQLVLF